ncbi:hypothetical protein FIBSPDRAFT_889541 [Athelia psychrophila]|uniref:Uncharacterized protein n=1 Tax=Athelia psychrophila TaxID=1759441 RepID=A0A166LX96_9AGAM|nr:hypothetical protein FIBSPDRAFT_889541 [Fibularhizoctonia sp. CBS 109695]
MAVDHSVLCTVRLRRLLRPTRELGLAALDQDAGSGLVIHEAVDLPQFRAGRVSRALVDTVARKYQNDGGGIECINQLTSARVPCLPPTICALFKYPEQRLDTRFSAHSLLIRYISVESTIVTDRELVGNMARKKSTHSLMGTRLLRDNILAPITGKVDAAPFVAATDARLDVVEPNSRLSSWEGPRHIIDSITELVESEDLVKNVREASRALHNMYSDKLVASLRAQLAQTYERSELRERELTEHLARLGSWEGYRAGAARA